MTNRSNDPWNRANDPWNRTDENRTDEDRTDEDPSGESPSEDTGSATAWAAYPPTGDSSTTDPPPDTPAIRGYPDNDATPTPAPSPQAPPTTPPPSLATLPAPSGRAGRPWKKVLGVAVIAVVVALVVSLVLVNGRGSTDATLSTVWSVTPQDVRPDEYGYYFSETLDGTEGTGFVVTDSVWVALLTDQTDDAPARLLGVEPGSGSVAWQLELPGAVCADRPSGDGTLACLSEDAAGWQVTRVDLDTGEVTESVPADVAEPRQVHLAADGLLVVGEAEPSVFSQLTHLADDGTVRWSTDLMELVGGETLFRESTSDTDAEEVTLTTRSGWTDVGDAVLLGHEDFVHIVPETEQVQVHRGSYPAVVGDRFFYQTSPGAVGYDADGTKLWYDPEVQLIRSTETHPARSLLHLDSSELTLRAVDPATGELSEPIHTFEDVSGTPQLNGPPDDTYVMNRGDVLRLSEDGRSVLWTAEVSDANSLTHAFTVDGATLLTTSPLTGLDAATGEELWTAESESRDVSVVDDRLVSLDRRALTVLGLP